MKKRGCALCLAVIMVVSLLPANLFVFGATTVARVDGSKSYSKFSEAWAAAAKSGTHTIDLLTDVKIEKCLEIPANCNLTINMGYRAFIGTHTNKNDPNCASDSGGDGTLFHINKGAHVVFNGNALNGSDVTERRGTIKSNVWFLDNTGSKIIKGALITGGGTDSTDGGGAFRIEQGVSLTFKNVTVAGNIADEYGLLYGSGGAIKVLGSNVNIDLENSSIMYNYAERDGGGIYVDGENCSISLVNSHIDNNKSGTDGGGIFSNKKYCSIELSGSTLSGNRCGGDGGAICYSLYTTVERSLILANGSTVTSNIASKRGGALYIGGEHLTVDGGTFYGNSAKEGGAIYCNNDSISLSNARFENNYAKESGGAIYLYDEDCVVRNSEILLNRASYGGGLYIYGSDNQLEGCIIEHNAATTSSGGVFVYNPGLPGLSSATLGLSGSLIIRNNTGKNNSVSNLVLGSRTYLVGSVGSNSEIHIDREPGRLTDDPGAYNDNGFYSDRPNTYVKWVNDKNSSDYRHLMVLSGTDPDTSQREIVAPGSGTAPVQTSYTYTVSSTNPALAGAYPVYKGLARTETTDGLNAYYYTDGYFFNNPFSYDEHLATMSIVLEMSAFNAVYDFDSLDNNIGYSNRFRGVKQLLADIGCDDEKTYISDSFTVKPTTDSIGFAIGQKALKNAEGEDTGYTLVPVVVRGQGYEAEWASNVTLGLSGEAAGFKSAATQVFSAIRSYIENYGLTEQCSNGKLRFWVVGYSRAGATANLTSKRLIDEYQNLGNAVYGYTFEAPQGGVSSELHNDVNYTSIHNTINYSDFVPYVAPVDMDFMRYGVDHYVPGSTAGTAQTFIRPYAGSMTGSGTIDATGASSGARFMRDNIWYDTNTSEYAAQREVMLAQLKAVTDAFVFDDYFHLAEINIGSAIFFGFVDDNGSDDVTMASYLQDFFHYFQRWALDGNSREVYSETFEQAIATLVNAIMQLSDEQMFLIGNRMMNIIPLLPQIIASLLADIAVFGSDFDNFPLIVVLYMDLLAMGIISEETIKESEFSTRILSLALRILSGDYQNDADEYPEGTLMDYDEDNNLMQLGTFIYNISNIVLNHMPALNYAWLRSYDSFYLNDTAAAQTLYQVSQAAASDVKQPVATASGNLAGGSTTCYGEATIKLKPDDANRGGAVYYTIYLNDKVYGKANTLYNTAEGIKLLPSVTGEVSHYKVVAHTMWFDTPGANTTLTIDVLPNTAHSVKINGELYGTYEVNQTVVVDGSLENRTLTGWTLPQGLALSFGTLTDSVIGFTMPYNDVNLTAEYVQMQVQKPRADIPGGLFNDDAAIHFSTETVGATIVYDVTREVEGVAGTTPVTVTSDTLNLVAVEGKKVTYSVKAYAQKAGLLDSELLQTEYVVDKESQTFNITIHATDNATWTRDWTLSAKNGDTVTVEAPYVQDEMFKEWLSATGTTLSEANKASGTLNITVTQDITLNVRYAPIVNAIEMTIANPEAGHPLAEKAENAKITITNVYNLSDFGVELDIDWSPASRRAEYGTTYTAKIPIDQVTAYDFAVSDKLAITINNGAINGSLVQGADGPELWCTFPKTESEKLTGIETPEDISLEYGTTKAELQAALPEFISVNFSNGCSALAPITWDDFTYSTGIFSEQDLTIEGSISMSGINNPDHISNAVTVNVLVSAAEKVANPVANVVSGDYEAAQNTVLTCSTEGATIYYTLDGSTPTTASAVYSGAITIPAGNEGETVTTTLRAIAVASRMQSSDIVTYTYSITIPAPEPTATVTPTAVPTQNPTAVPTQNPVQPTSTPVPVTEAPTAPTDVPATPTEAPVTPTEAPVTPTEAPVAPTEAPVTPTGTPGNVTEAPTATPTPTGTPSGDGSKHSVFPIVLGAIAGVGALSALLWFIFKKKGIKLPFKRRKNK